MKLKYWIENFLIWKIAMPIIRKYGAKDNGMITHFHDEGGCLSEVDDLLCVFGLQGHSNNSAPFILNAFDRAARFQLLGPLKFTDDEWGNSLDFDESKQNRRLSSIFKYADGSIIDIDAITWIEKSGYRYDIATNTFEQCEYAKKGYGFHGSCVVVFKPYKKVDNWSGGEYTLMGSSQRLNEDVISGKQPFLAKNRVKVPVIEIYDSTDTHNDFLCYFTIHDLIPDNFYCDYQETASRYNGPEKQNMYQVCMERCDELCEKLIGSKTA